MAWWEGTQEAGLERSLRLGLPPPPGSMPTEMSNAYRMAPREHDPWNFDAPKGPTRGELVAGWQQQAADAEQPRRQLARGQPKKRRKGLTMKDAGDALAAWETDEYARLNRSSGLL